MLLGSLSIAEESAPLGSADNPYTTTIYTSAFGENLTAYWVYTVYEVSGRLLHVQQKEHYLTGDKNKSCFHRYMYEGEHWRLFDLRVYKNDKLIYESPYFNTHRCDDNTNVSETIEICFTVEKNSTIIYDYYLGNKINVFSDSEFFSSILSDIFESIGWVESERYYPFERYNFTDWVSLDKNYTENYLKIVLPPSLEVDKNETEFSCLLCSPHIAFTFQPNIGTKFCGGDVPIEEGFLRSDEKNIVVFSFISNAFFTFTGML